MPIQITQIAHSILKNCLQDQMEFVLPKVVKRLVQGHSMYDWMSKSEIKAD